MEESLPERKYSLGLKQEDSVHYNTVFSGRNDDEEYNRIRVANPTKNPENVVFYKVVAFDKKGEFCCQRRYSDFVSLREAWRKRIPGLFHPFLPEKKFFGNTDLKHLEERCFLLEQFLRKVYKTPYLLISEEFALFARHSNPVQTLKKAYLTMPEQSIE